jgi:hypothetical protein
MKDYGLVYKKHTRSERLLQLHVIWKSKAGVMVANLGRLSRLRWASLRQASWLPILVAHQDYDEQVFAIMILGPANLARCQLQVLRLDQCQPHHPRGSAFESWTTLACMKAPRAAGKRTTLATVIPRDENHVFLGSGRPWAGRPRLLLQLLYSSKQLLHCFT